MKNSVLLITLFLTIFGSILCHGQEASLQAYPDRHISNIFSIDTDKDAKNALSLDKKGRTIFWDLETQRPLRMWEYYGNGYLTKMIFNEGTGVSLFGDYPTADDRQFAKFNFIFYDLFEGLAYDTLSIEENFNLVIRAFDFAEGSERKQDIVLLFKETVMCVDLYKRKIKWQLKPPTDARDIYYLNKDTILLYTADSLLYIDQNTLTLKQFNTDHIENFNRDNVREKYHFKEENEYLIVEPLDPNSEISFKFKNTAGIKIETIYRITGNKDYSYMHMNLSNRSGLALIDHKKEKIAWHRKIISEKETIGILESAVAINAHKIVYTDLSRRIKILDGKSGNQLGEIHNNRTASRSTFITPDFKHMIYSTWDDGDDGYQSKSTKKATYYVDLTNPTNTQFLFQDVALKIQATDNNSILILSEQGLSEFDINLHTYYSNTLGFPFPLIGKITDMDYDTLSGRMLIKSENKIDKEELIVNKSEVKDLIEEGVKVGIIYDQFPLYGELTPISDTTSKFTFDQNITFVYHMDYMEPLAFIYKKNGDFRPSFVPGGKYIIMDGEKNSRSEKFLYDVDAQKTVNPYRESKITNIEKDLYSDLVLFRYRDNTCVLVETDDFKEVKRFKLDATPIILVINSKLNTLIYSDLKKPNMLFSYDLKNDMTDEMDGVFCQKFEDLSSDGKYLALTSFKAIQIVDVEDGTTVTNEVEEFEAEPEFVKFSKDKPMAISGRLNGRLNFWNLDERRVNATFMLSPGGKYVIYDKIGIFDCHPDVMNEIFYTVRKETVDLDQLKYLFWEEDMLAYVLENESYDVEEAKEEKIIRLYPDVELSTSEFQDTLIIKLTPNLGGLGQVAFYINNVEREEDVNPNDTLTEIKIPLSKYEDYLIPDRPNILGVVVYNSDSEDEEGLLMSKQKRIPIRYGKKRSENLFADDPSNDDNIGIDTTELSDTGTNDSGWGAANPDGSEIGETAGSKGYKDELTKAEALMLDVKKTRLIGLVVGTSDYGTDGEIDLKYADNDANSMENALNKTGKLLFEEDNKVIIHKLISKSSDTTLTSTKANILAKMKEMQSDIKVDDILVVFFSGHGFSHEKEYYYATKNANAVTLNGTDPDMASKTISATEINNFLKESKSLRKLLILDACYSGAFAEAINRKSGSSSQRKAMENIKDKTGVYILSSSLANQESLEMPALSQGVMTYSLLDGMSGKAAVDRVINVNDLIKHVINHVPDLAKRKGYFQQPQFIVPTASMPFAIGLSDESIAPKGSKFQIGSAAVEDTMDTDYLLLNETIDEAIKTTSEQQANIPFMFNDLVTSDNFRIKGNYIETPNGIRLEASIIRENKRIKKITISENTTKEVAASLVQELIKLFGSPE